MISINLENALIITQLRTYQSFNYKGTSGKKKTTKERRYVIRI
jgi:hypothetical protein